MEVGVLNIDGIKQSTYTLPEDVFEEPLNRDLLHQVVSSLQKRKQQPVAHTKDRSERRGGGKKPWRQKGTGRARHGSRRSPIWRKGGVTFGPTKDRNFDADIPKKMKRKAMRMVLSSIVAQNELYIVDNFTFDSISTKMAKNTLHSISNGTFESQNNTLIVLSESDQNLYKSVRNIPNVSTVLVNSLSIEDLLEADIVLTDPRVIDILAEKYRG